MLPPVDVSVIIPTYRRPAQLAACLARLARQSLAPDRYEVLVGLDGPDDETGACAGRAWREAGGGADGLRVVPCPRAGLNATRNRLLDGATGSLVLSLNDDVLAAPGLLDAHRRAHDEARGRLGRDAIVGGHSPFVEYEGATLFDALCQHTPMLFFYDRMVADPDRWRDWGFRHCFGLNFSAPLALVRAVGGFTAFPLLYGYDDIEIAWRIQRHAPGTPVLFRPEALAPHDHRYRPAEVLDRERRLGGTAWRFAGENPGFALATFGRDIRADAEVGYSREFVGREARDAERLRETFLGFERTPASVLDGAGAAERRGVLRALAQQHLLLKRWEWRRGLLEAADAEPRASAPAPSQARAGDGRAPR
jgi:GT2 family glycosyltransferase